MKSGDWSSNMCNKLECERDALLRRITNTYALAGTPQPMPEQPTVTTEPQKLARPGQPHQTSIAVRALLNRSRQPIRARDVARVIGTSIGSARAALNLAVRQGYAEAIDKERHAFAHKGVMRWYQRVALILFCLAVAPNVVQANDLILKAPSPFWKTMRPELEARCGIRVSMLVTPDDATTTATVTGNPDQLSCADCIADCLAGRKSECVCGSIKTIGLPGTAAPCQVPRGGTKPAQPCAGRVQITCQKCPTVDQGCHECLSPNSCEAIVGSDGSLKPAADAWGSDTSVDPNPLHTIRYQFTNRLTGNRVSVPMPDFATWCTAAKIQ